MANRLENRSRSVQRQPAAGQGRNLPSTHRAPEKLRMPEDGLTETDRRRLRTSGAISAAAGGLFGLIGVYYVVLGVFMVGIIVALIGGALGYMGSSMLKRARG